VEFGRGGAVEEDSGGKGAAAVRCWWSQGRRKGEKQQKEGAQLGFIGQA
jgi:hypothetical protein